MSSAADDTAEDEALANVAIMAGVGEVKQKEHKALFASVAEKQDQDAELFQDDKGNWVEAGSQEAGFGTRMKMKMNETWDDLMLCCFPESHALGWKEQMKIESTKIVDGKKYVPPRLSKYLRHEHLALAVIWSNAYYPNPNYKFTRPLRMLLLVAYALLNFTVALIVTFMFVNTLLTETSPKASCSTMRSCYSACDTAFGFETSANGVDYSTFMTDGTSPAATCVTTSVQAFFDTDMFFFPNLTSSTSAAIVSAAAQCYLPSMLDSPCLPACISTNDVYKKETETDKAATTPSTATSNIEYYVSGSLTKDTDRVPCAEATSTMRDGFLCYNPQDVFGCDKEVDQRLFLLARVGVSVAFVFPASWFLKRMINFTLSSRKFTRCRKCIGFPIIGGLLACITCLAYFLSFVDLDKREGGVRSLFTTFAISFGVSLALDFLKLTFVYFIYSSRTLQIQYDRLVPDAGTGEEARVAAEKAKKQQKRKKALEAGMAPVALVLNEHLEKKDAASEQRKRLMMHDTDSAQATNLNMGTGGTADVSNGTAVSSVLPPVGINGTQLKSKGAGSVSRGPSGAASGKSSKYNSMRRRSSLSSLKDMSWSRGSSGDSSFSGTQIASEKQRKKLERKLKRESRRRQKSNRVSADANGTSTSHVIDMLNKQTAANPEADWLHDEDKDGKHTSATNTRAPNSRQSYAHVVPEAKDLLANKMSEIAEDGSVHHESVTHEDAATRAIARFMHDTNSTVFDTRQLTFVRSNSMPRLNEDDSDDDTDDGSDDDSSDDDVGKPSKQKSSTKSAKVVAAEMDAKAKRKLARQEARDAKKRAAAAVEPKNKAAKSSKHKKASASMPVVSKDVRASTKERFKRDSVFLTSAISKSRSQSSALPLPQKSPKGNRKSGKSKRSTAQPSSKSSSKAQSPQPKFEVVEAKNASKGYQVELTGTAENVGSLRSTLKEAKLRGDDPDTTTVKKPTVAPATPTKPTKPAAPEVPEFDPFKFLPGANAGRGRHTATLSQHGIAHKTHVPVATPAEQSTSTTSSASKVNSRVRGSVIAKPLVTSAIQMPK